MVPGQLPRTVKMATDLLRADPVRAWTVEDLAASCGIPRRTLEKHFRSYVHQTPVEFLRTVRLEQARAKLLSAAPHTTITDVANQCGFNHFGRFSAWYRERYGENPLATVRRNQSAAVRPALPPHYSPMLEKPSLAVFPLDLTGPGTHGAAGMADEIAAALGRVRWIEVTAPFNARYHLRTKVRTNGRGQLRATVTLFDASSQRHLWADCWDGGLDDAFEFEDRVSIQVARALQPALRNAEIDRASDKDPAKLTAWELAMRAMPGLLSIDPNSERNALELLERAMELAPRAALPMAMAAWCHGLRAGHHFTINPGKEREKAVTLAQRAGLLNAGDPLVETMLAGAYTLAHDLATASVHSDRAVMLDGGSGWAWGRSGWIHAYRGQSTDALERFHLARTLASSDSLSFLWCVGIAAAHFEAARYDEAVRWYRRGLAEQPGAVWINRFLTASLALAGRKDEAGRSFCALASDFPTLSIAQVRAGLPHSTDLLDRVSDGLESVGMPLF